jgi:hypothetical protein
MLFVQVPGIGPVAGLGLTNSLFETYDLSHALPLTSGTPELINAPFSTSDGPLEVLSISALSFQATTVPEPSTWAMLLLGFAGLGYAGYRASRRPQPPHKKGPARWLARKAPRRGLPTRDPNERPCRGLVGRPSRS